MAPKLNTPPKPDRTPDETAFGEYPSRTAFCLHSGDARRKRSASSALDRREVKISLRARDAGIVDSERQGLWAYYYVIPDALEELSSWLS